MRREEGGGKPGGMGVGLREAPTKALRAGREVNI